MSDNYKAIDIAFQDIHNIHVVRESFYALRDLFGLYLSKTIDDSMTTNDWFRRYRRILSALRNGKVARATWFVHLQSVLSGAVQVAEFLHERKGSVVVHCSDGNLD